MTLSDDQEAAKAWRLRNSDQLYTFGDEYGMVDRLHAPPAFDLVDADLPPTPHKITTPADDSGLTARSFLVRLGLATEYELETFPRSS